MGFPWPAFGTLYTSLVLISDGEIHGDLCEFHYRVEVMAKMYESGAFYVIKCMYV